MYARILAGFATLSVLLISAWGIYVFLRTSDWREDKMKTMTTAQKGLRWYGLVVLVGSIVGVLWLIGVGVMG
jgi:hypothetical protein